jgi:hypothetical protein
LPFVQPRVAVSICQRSSKIPILNFEYGKGSVVRTMARH